jgi:HSP20 family protein
MTETETRTPAPAEQNAPVPVFDRAWMPFWTLRNAFDDRFDDFYRSGWTGWSVPRARPSDVAPRPPAAVPTLDVIDKENEVKLIADLPGMTEKEIDVQVTDSTLTISGEKREEIEEGDNEGERYLSERRFGSFVRRIPLPEGIDKDEIDASFKNGVLTVHLPKKPEAQNPARKIEVRAGV